MNVKETVKTETLEAEANQIWDEIIHLTDFLNEIFCPDYCNGSGLCRFCAIEAEVTELNGEWHSIVDELKRRKAPGW